MKKILFTCVLSLSPIIATAEVDFGGLLAELEGTNYANISRAKYLSHMERIYPELSAATMLLFSRVSPNVAAHVPNLEWSSAHAEAHECIYDGLKKADALQELDTVHKASAQTLKALRDNPGINLATLGDYPEYMAAMTPPKTYATLLGDCGVLKLNSEAFKESGLSQALAQEQ